MNYPLTPQQTAEIDEKTTHTDQQDLMIEKKPFPLVSTLMATGLFVALGLAGYLFHQNQLLLRELSATKTKDTTSDIFGEDISETTLPTSELLSDNMNKEASWQTKKVLGKTLTYSISYPPDYFFQDGILTSYDPQKVYPGIPVQSGEGKCDFWDGTIEEASDIGELSNQELIVQGPTQIRKLTLTETQDGPGQEKGTRFYMFAVGSDSTKILVNCYSDWQTNHTEILSILQTINIQ